MPFTVSHIAAVIPAHRPLARHGLFTAAVIGSMVPDFGFLLPRGALPRWQTHSLPALLTFCLPVGLLIYALTQWLIRPALREVVPNGPYARLAARGGGAWRAHPLRWAGVIGALLFGALTHLIWDGFTHENARGVRLFPQLLRYGPDMAGHSLRLYAWLQYGSSVVGLVVVAAALALWLLHAPAPTPAPLRRLPGAERWSWSALYLAVFVAALIALSLRAVPLEALEALGLRGGLWSIAIASLRAAALSLLAVSVLLRVRLLFAPRLARRGALQ